MGNANDYFWELVFAQSNSFLTSRPTAPNVLHWACTVLGRKRMSASVLPSACMVVWQAWQFDLDLTRLCVQASGGHLSCLL